MCPKISWHSCGHVTQVSFQLNKAYLEAYGLSIDPEFVSKLQGAPEYESVDLALSLNTNKCRTPNGVLDLVLPIDIKYGPAILVSVRAHIITPELKLSHEALDFGEVQTGHCKVMMLKLTNPKEVACEWAIRKPMEATKGKDWEFFRFEPQEGCLDPEGTAVVKVHISCSSCSS